jgi:hypothetical protein
VAYEDVLFIGDRHNGLNSISLLRVSKIFSVHPGIVNRKLGRITEDELAAVRWSLKTYFNQKKWPG